MKKKELSEIHKLINNGYSTETKEIIEEFLKYNDCPKSITSYLKEYLNEEEKNKLSLNNQRTEINRKSQFIGPIVFAGLFRNIEEVSFALKRLSYYILPFCKKIIIYTDIRGLENISEFNDLDEIIIQNFDKYKHKIIYELGKNNFEKINNSIDHYDQQKSGFFLNYSSEVALIRKNIGLNGLKIYDVSNQSRNEGSLYIQGIYDYLKKTNFDFKETNANNLNDFLIKNKSDEIAIVCNGPSMRNINLHYRFNKKLTAITCNTTILNRDLSDYFNFICCVFADPIFHFGISKYASEFRSKLSNYLKENKLVLIIPEKYLHIAKYYIELHGNILISLAPEKQEEPILNIGLMPKVKVTANILTYIMLPTGTSLAKKNLYLFGCDGRKYAANDYFWSHDKKSQLSDNKMENIKKVHPSFFKIDYDDYYNEHLVLCSQYIKEIRKVGIEVNSETPTYIKIFDNKKTNLEKKIKLKPLLAFAISPEYGIQPGHYLGFEKVLSKQFKKNNWSQKILVSKKYNTINKLDEDNLELIPIFKESFSPPHKEVSYGRMSDEIISGLENIIQNTPGNSIINFYYYISSFRLVDKLRIELNRIKNLNLKDRKINFFVNGFWDAHMINDPSFKFDELYKCLESIKNLPFNFKIFYSIDTLAAKNQINEKIYKLNGNLVSGNINVLPFFPIIDQIEIINQINKNNNNKLVNFKDRKFDIFFAGTSQEAKGVSVCIEVILKLLKKKSNINILFRITKNHLSKINIEKINQLKLFKNVTFTDPEDIDSDFNYMRLFFDSKIVALSYDPKYFKAKHSAILVDAISAGCSIVARSNTWQSKQLDLYTEDTFPYFLHNGYLDSFYEAINKCLFVDRNRTQDSCLNFFKKYNPKKFINYFEQKIHSNQQIILSNNSNSFLTITEEFACFDLLKYKTNNNYTMIDVGCCHGASCGIFLDNNYDTHAFEPTPVNFKYLKKKFKDKKINLNNFAIGNKNEELDIAISKSSFGRHSLYNVEKNDLDQLLKVKVKRLDSYFQDNNLKEVDYLKIDVEGFEPEAIEGLGIYSNKISIMQVEFDNQKLSDNLQKIIDRIENNFDLIYISSWELGEQGYGSEHKWQSLYKYSKDIVLVNGSWGNVIAIKTKDFKLNSSLEFDEIIKNSFQNRLTTTSIN